jgi:hypothetical protein
MSEVQPAGSTTSKGIAARERYDFKDEKGSRIRIVGTYEVDHRGLQACSGPLQYIDKFDGVLEPILLPVPAPPDPAGLVSQDYSERKRPGKNLRTQIRKPKLPCNDGRPVLVHDISPADRAFPGHKG